MTATHHMKNRKVEARQHDGSDESAVALVTWIREGHADAYPILKGEADLSGYLSDAFVVIKNAEGKIATMVRPNFWVVKLEEGVFFGCYPDIFRRLYKQIKEVKNETEVPQAPQMAGAASV